MPIFVDTPSNWFPVIEMAKKTDLLLDRIRLKDENALAELLERYREPIQRVARRLLGRALRPHLDSADLMQLVHETLLVGVRGQTIDITQPDKMMALAVTLLRRKVAYYWRKIKRDPAMKDTVDIAGAGQIASESESPVDTFAFSEEVEKLLQSLDPVDRRLLELRLEGHTTADVANILMIDACTLRVRLGRLRKRLKDRGYSENAAPI